MFASVSGVRYFAKQAANVDRQCYSKTLFRLNIQQSFFVVTTTITLHLSLTIHERFVLKCKIDRINFNVPFFKINFCL